jgi:D-sedoheptulose 7-phosphate isomerase
VTDPPASPPGSPSAAVLPTTPLPTAQDLAAGARRKAREAADTFGRFMDEHAEAMVACAQAMGARLVTRGARLWTFGNGGSACDAQHAALEHLHPVLEKRPALKAHALNADASVLTAIGNDRDFSTVFAQQLRTLAHKDDVALAISTSGKAANVVRGAQAAKDMGLLVVALTGKDGGKLASLADHAFVVPSFSIHRIQEAHVLAIHVLWDLMHVAQGQPDSL